MKTQHLIFGNSMIDKKRTKLLLRSFFGALEGIRIPDLPLRRRTLYPAELQAHIFRPLYSGRIFTNFCIR